MIATTLQPPIFGGQQYITTLFGRAHHPGPFVLQTPSPPVRPLPIRPSACIALCDYCHPRGSSPLSLYAPTGPPTRLPPPLATHSADYFAVFASIPPISAPLSGPCPVSSFFPSLPPSAAPSVLTSFLLLVVGSGHVLVPVDPWSAPPPRTLLPIAPTAVLVTCVHTGHSQCILVGGG